MSLDGIFDVGAAPYSAAGNYSEDATAKVQAAIGDAELVGGIVYLRPGKIYKVAGLTSTKPFTLWGPGAMLKLPTGATDPILVVQDLDNPIDGHRFQDVTFDGASAGQGDAGLLVLNNAVGFLCDHVIFQHAGNPGVTDVNGVSISAGTVGAPGSAGTFRDCIGQYCTKAAFNWTTEAINGLFEGCTARYNTGHTGGQTPGFQINGGFNGRITGCYAYENEGAGFLIGSAGTTPWTHSRRILLDHNYAYLNGQGTVEGSGFKVANADPGGATDHEGRIILDSNYSYQNGVNVNAHGFLIENVRGVRAVGNWAWENALAGMLAQHCIDIDIIENVFEANNQAEVSNVPGLMVLDLLRYAIEGNRAWDVQASPTQAYGLAYWTGTACDQGRRVGNRFYPNATGAVLETVAPTNEFANDNATASGTQGA